jgi:hypothetical protein
MNKFTQYPYSFYITKTQISTQIQSVKKMDTYQVSFPSFRFHSENSKNHTAELLQLRHLATIFLHLYPKGGGLRFKVQRLNKVGGGGERTADGAGRFDAGHKKGQIYGLARVLRRRETGFRNYPKASKEWLQPAIW